MAVVVAGVDFVSAAEPRELVDLGGPEVYRHLVGVGHDAWTLVAHVSAQDKGLVQQLGNGLFPSHSV